MAFFKLDLDLTKEAKKMNKSSVTVKADAEANHFEPAKTGFSTLGSKRTRRKSKALSSDSMSTISSNMEKRFGIYSKAIKRTSNKDLEALAVEFSKTFNSASQADVKRIENIGRAIVRNPIYDKKIGRNSKKTEKEKGFNWASVDTGQLFNSIKAKYKKEG